MYASHDRGKASPEHGSPRPNSLLLPGVDQSYLISNVDDLFSEALLGIQDLDVPTGYAQVHPDPPMRTHRLGISNATFNNVYKLHQRHNSGTAIFGFVDHNRDLSLTGVNSHWLSHSLNQYNQGQKSVAPNDILLKLPSHHHRESDFIFGVNQADLMLGNDDLDNHTSPIQKATPEKPKQDVFNPFNPISHPLPPPATPKTNDFVVTKTHPKRYKFPPSPPPPPTPKLSQLIPKTSHINNYLARYLQELNSLPILQTPYVNDIGPLLEDENGGLGPSPSLEEPAVSQRYVPLPIQQPLRPPKPTPSPHKHQRPTPQFYLPQRGPAPPRLPEHGQFLPQRLIPQFLPEQQQQYSSQRLHNQSLIERQLPQYAVLEQGRPLLPPPEYSAAAQDSPEWQSSPEGVGLATPSRPAFFSKNADSPFLHTPTKASKNSNYNELPLHSLPNGAFCKPQFFSDTGYDTNDHFNLDPEALCSSPIPQPRAFVDSSPVSYFTSSPNRPALTSHPDDTVDANETISQLTPLKQQLDTPTRIRIQWSPIISPSAKASKDVRRHIQQQTCLKSRVKKTSTLPPGELDHYWEGPDDDKNYTCTYKNCGKKFTRRYNVRSHIQTHLSDRPFACPHCPKRFVRQHDMNRHIKGHTEMRFSRCGCGKEFSRLDALKKHQMRNICSGGVAYATPNGVSKPHPKHSVELHLGHNEAGKLIHQLSSHA